MPSLWLTPFGRKKRWWNNLSSPFCGPWRLLGSIFKTLQFWCNCQGGQGISNIFFYCCSSTVISLFLPPLPSPSHPHSPPLILPLFGLSMCPLYMCPITLHPFPPITSSHLPSSYCLFLISTSLVEIFCLLICFVGSTYRWDHMVFVPHCLAYFT